MALRHPLPTLSMTSFLMLLFYDYPCALSKRAYQSRRVLACLLLGVCLGCSTLPQSEEIQIRSSNRERETPRIVGIHYIGTYGRPGQGPAEFLMPMGLALSGQGWLYVADAGNNRVQVIDTSGNFITEFGSRGWRVGEFDTPTDIALSFQRSYRLYVADTGNNRVQYCNLVDEIFYPLQVGGTSVSETHVALDRPEGIGIGRNGDVYVVDTGNHRWLQFNIEGLPVRVRGSFGSGTEHLWHATDLGVDAHGNLYIVDTGNHLIKKYDFSGNLVHQWGGEGRARGEFREPKRIALDEWNYLYVTDSANRRVQVFTPAGLSVTELRVDALLEPAGIAVSKTGRMFVSDAEAHDIKVFQVFYSGAERSDTSSGQ